jgi:hypothetical protein
MYPSSCNTAYALRKAPFAACGRPYTYACAYTCIRASYDRARRRLCRRRSRASSRWRCSSSCGLSWALSYEAACPQLCVPDQRLLPAGPHPCSSQAPHTHPWRYRCFANKDGLSPFRLPADVGMRFIGCVENLAKSKNSDTCIRS